MLGCTVVNTVNVMLQCIGACIGACTVMGGLDIALLSPTMLTELGIGLFQCLLPGRDQVMSR